MRLLFVPSVLPPERLGGAETYALQLAEVLGELGAKVDIVGRAGRGVRVNVESHAHGDWIRIASPFHAYFGFMIRLTSWLRHHAHEYDAIQFFDMNHVTGTGLRATRDSGVCRIARVEGVLSWSDEQLADTRMPLLARRTKRWLRTADRYVVVSRSEMGPLGADVGHGKVTFIPNGIDVDRFAFAPLPASKVIVCPARLRAEKNHRALLEAFRLVRQQVPDARLVLAGDGPLLAEIRGLVGTWGLSESVDVPGHVDDMPRLLAGSRVAALLSTAEGPALGILEAAACGRPAVVTGVGGLVDSVKDGTTGFVVSPGDVSAAADALVKLLTDDELCARMGANAAEFVREERSIQIVASHYLQYLQTCARDR